jgi:hypothetical protein
VFPVRYELGFYILEDGILLSYLRGNLKSYSFLSLFIKNSNLVYTNKPFVSNLICYCEFTKYLFYNGGTR